MHDTHQHNRFVHEYLHEQGGPDNTRNTNAIMLHASVAFFFLQVELQVSDSVTISPSGTPSTPVPAATTATPVAAIAVNGTVVPTTAPSSIEGGDKLCRFPDTGTEMRFAILKRSYVLSGEDMHPSLALATGDDLPEDVGNKVQVSKVDVQVTIELCACRLPSHHNEVHFTTAV